jgi:hypothetical protein
MLNVKAAQEVAANISHIVADASYTEQYRASEGGHEDALDAMGEALLRLYPKAKFSYGLYRGVLIFPRFVLKFSLWPTRNTRLMREYNLIRLIKAGVHSKHVPETVFVEENGIPYLVQEKIAGVGAKTTGDEWVDVIELAEALNITDAHGGNYGWVGKRGNRYPVFIDLDGF